MRLYVNDNEVPYLKAAVFTYLRVIKHSLHSDPDIVQRVSNLCELIDLCDQLQGNMRRSGGKENDLT